MLIACYLIFKISIRASVSHIPEVIDSLTCANTSNIKPLCRINQRISITGKAHIYITFDISDTNELDSGVLDPE